MVSQEPNVAYDGTSSDLGFGAGDLFKPTADFNNLFGSDMFGSTYLTNFGNDDPTTYSSTVSPQQLMMGSMDSVPSSANIPDLTPSSEMLETPDTSPMFADNLMFPAESNDWSSLFPENNPLFPEDAPLFPEDNSFAQPKAPVAPTLSRQDSASSTTDSRKRSLGTPSASASPMGVGVRPSAVAGVRKKSKPLAPIELDKITDPVAVKRARNTAAARKSREKRVNQMETLEAELQQQKDRNATLEARIAQLEAENALLKGQHF